MKKTKSVTLAPKFQKLIIEHVKTLLKLQKVKRKPIIAGLSSNVAKFPVDKNRVILTKNTPKDLGK